MTISLNLEINQREYIIFSNYSGTAAGMIATHLPLKEIPKHHSVILKKVQCELDLEFEIENSKMLFNDGIDFEEEYQKLRELRGKLQSIKKSIPLSPNKIKFLILKIEEKLVGEIEGRIKPVLKNNKEGFIYLIDGFDNGIKIGKSLQPDKRVSQLITELPFKTNIIKIYKVNLYKSAEKSLHDLFANKRLNGEWFKLDANDLIEMKNHLNQGFNGKLVYNNREFGEKNDF